LSSEWQDHFCNLCALTLDCLLVQVAAQEGSYLADCFNRMKTCEEYPEGPIRIRGAGRHRFKPFRSVFHAMVYPTRLVRLRVDRRILEGIKFIPS
jgi:hypothetical protein